MFLRYLDFISLHEKYNRIGSDREVAKAVPDFSKIDYLRLEDFTTLHNLCAMHFNPFIFYNACGKTSFTHYDE